MCLRGGPFRVIHVMILPYEVPVVQGQITRVDLQKLAYQLLTLGGLCYQIHKETDPFTRLPTS